MNAILRTVISGFLIFFYTNLHAEGRLTSTARHLYPNVKKTMEIHHPELLQTEPLTNFTLTIPKECEKIGICENIPNYPYKYISNIIKMCLKNHVHFYKDVNILNEGPNEMLSEAEDLCISEEIQWCPLAVRDIYNNWHLALNTKICLQGFVGEKCPEGSKLKCSDVAVFTNMYAGVCHQKSIKRKIIVLDTKTGHVKEITFPVPSCCTCIAKKLARISFHGNNN